MIFSSIALLIGVLIIFLAFFASFLGDNIVVIVFQIAGSFAPPILGVYLLGFFAPRVNSRVSLLDENNTFDCLWCLFLECSCGIFTEFDISNMGSRGC